MATIVKEDGSVVSGANSYVTESEVSVYFTDVGKDDTAWLALTSTGKEQAVLRSARFLEAEFGPDFMGTRRQRGQALSWPRYGVTGLDNYLVDSTTVPSEVLLAQFELIFKTVDGTEFYTDVAESSSTLEEKEVQIGPIKSKKKYRTSAAGEAFHAYVESLLDPYLRGGANVIELMRA